MRTDLDFGIHDRNPHQRPRRQGNSALAWGLGGFLLGVFTGGIIVLAVMLLRLNRTGSGQADPSSPAADKPEPAKPVPVMTKKSRKEKDKPVREVPFGEPAGDGDLVIRVHEAANNRCTGQYHGQFSWRDMLMVTFSVQNNSPGKIANWMGWQDKGTVQDEHGNTFKPCNLRGWEGLPHNDSGRGDNQYTSYESYLETRKKLAPGTSLIGGVGDRGTRVMPGKTYVNLIYFEHTPATSKQAAITLPCPGGPIKFTGPIVDRLR
jgi:hypothetical protein